MEGEISGYRPEKRFLSIREYASEVAWQWQQGVGVATPAAPQPPQQQQVARSRLLGRSGAQEIAVRSGIARLLSEIHGYYSGWSIAEECEEESEGDQIEELSDENEEQEDGQGDSSA